MARLSATGPAGFDDFAFDWLAFDGPASEGISMTTLDRLTQTLEEIRAAGLYKEERVITTPQSVEIKVADGSEVLNFCANN